MHALADDVRYALRGVRTAPGFYAVVVLTLALGIGANTAIFSVANAVIFRPLRAPDPDRIVQLMASGPAGTYPTITLPTANVWLSQTTPILEDVSAQRLDFVNLTHSTRSEQLGAGRVSAAFFRLYGATVELGRTFTLDEDRPEAAHVVILSHGLWLRRFAGDAAVVGQTIVLGQQPHEIIGVLRADFDPEIFDQPADVWVPFQIDPNTQDTGGEFCSVTGRLKPGVSMAAARAQLQTVVNDYRRTFPNRVPPRGTFTIVPLRDALSSSMRPSLVLLGGAVGLVLLVASANVANLLLVRGLNRNRELSIRVSLGATRGRVIRQLMTESAVLCAAGAALGVVASTFTIRALLAAYPVANPMILGGNSINIPRVGHSATAVTTDWRVLAFSLVLSVLTTIAFGLLPALRVSGIDLHHSSQHGTRGSDGQTRLRSLLVIGELGLAFTLVAGAALLIRTLVALQAIDTGFDPHHVLTMRMSVAGTPFEKRAGISGLTDQGARRLATIPGVVSSSASCCVPLETVWQLTFSILGRSEPPRLAGWTFVSPGYFDVFQIPLIRGRAFTDRDTTDAPAVIIINETMARRFWPHGDPLNDQLLVGRGVRPDYDADPARQIVGIVGDVRDTALNRVPRPAMYVPVAQVPDSVTALNVRLLPLAWVVRTRGEPHSVAASATDQLEKVSGGLPVSRVRSMDEVISESTARTQFNMLLMTVFGAAALLLSAMGVYGVMSYAVQQRTREFGIRIALGADRLRIRRILLAQWLKITVAGTVIGIAAAAALARTIAAFLFGVSARNPVIFFEVATILTIASLVATLVPSARAMRIEPAAALRQE